MMYFCLCSAMLRVSTTMVYTTGFVVVEPAPDVACVQLQVLCAQLCAYANQDNLSDFQLQIIKNFRVT